MINERAFRGSLSHLCPALSVVLGTVNFAQFDTACVISRTRPEVYDNRPQNTAQETLHVLEKTSAQLAFPAAQTSENNSRRFVDDGYRGVGKKHR